LVLVALLLAALLSNIPASAQKPKQQDRGVRDDSSSPQSTVSLGPYYALVIGNNNYKYLDKLQTPVNDASAFAKLLQEQYGFKERKLLLNATRDEIFTALTEYRRTLPQDSNLLIFYAGHGYHDRATDEAYWLPVDAQSDNPDHWISANDITTNIRAISSKHVLVISDSCYSGVLRDAKIKVPLEGDAYLAQIIKSKSRNLMSSGGDEPVADTNPLGPPGHSVFANALLKFLAEMELDQFTVADLFPRIKRGVAGRSPQVPQYNYIRNSGDEFGDFVFSRGGKDVVVGPLPPGSGGTRVEDVQSLSLPEIACKKEASVGLPPKIQQGDLVPCKFLDQPLQWLKAYLRPDLPGAAAQAKWTAMLTITVNEEGRVTDVKPRGGTSLNGTDTLTALRISFILLQTNPPTYQGKRVKSSFALDIDFGQ
jgi:hypothetical protein